MKRRLICVLAAWAVCCAVAPVRADVSLFDYAVHYDGILLGRHHPLPSGSLLDTTTGLGSVRIEFSGAGPHYGLLFVDHEFSERENTFFNEFAAVSGVPEPGQSWEFDEPGYLFGDIVDNFILNSLDNSGISGPEDISMAMGWSFFLQDGESAVLEFLLTETQPAGFHLHHFDPDSGEGIYFSGALTIHRQVPTTLPEGKTVVSAFLLGCVVLAGARRWRPFLSA